MRKIWIFLLLLTACRPENIQDLNGYVEGEYVYVSPYSSGILDEINVIKGQKVNAGDKLFSADKEIWQANLVQARNELDKAYARFADLNKGKRKQELDIIVRQKEQAEAIFENAAKEYNRVKKLADSGTASRSDYDARLSAYESAGAKVAEYEASLQTARLAAREDTLKAAENDIEIARQALLKVEKQVQNNSAVSKVSGRVEDIYFRIGEFVPAGTPVISVLPPGNIKIRFFVSQQMFPQIKMNMPLTVFCDGCSGGIPARVSFISTQSEFTPPVIYSVESREKLVFMIEAVFENENENLHPGLPVTVRMGQND